MHVNTMNIVARVVSKCNEFNSLRIDNCGILRGILIRVVSEYAKLCRLCLDRYDKLKLRHFTLSLLRYARLSCLRRFSMVFIYPHYPIAELRDGYMSQIKVEPITVPQFSS